MSRRKRIRRADSKPSRIEPRGSPDMAGRDFHPPTRRPGVEPERFAPKNSRIAKPTKAVDIARVKASASGTQVRLARHLGRLSLLSAQGLSASLVDSVS